MFSRVSTLLFFVAFAAASATPRGHNPPPTDQCTTGSIQCCNSVEDAGNDSVKAIAGLLGIDISSITGLVGLTCDPITVIGGGGDSCTSQTVCCTGDNFQGLLVVGCTPININV